MRVRIDVDRKALEATPPAEEIPNSATVGEALTDGLAAAGCELAVLPDGTLLVRREPDAPAWTLGPPRPPRPTED